MERKPILFSALVFATIMLWVFFLNASGFSLKQALLLGNYKATISILLSTNFIIAALLFPLPVAIAAIATKKIEKKTARLYCLAGALAATIVSIIIFPTATENPLLFIFYFASFAIAIETADLGFKELKRFITPRAVGNATSKANLIITIGFFIASSLIIMPDPKYIQSFEDSIISSVSQQGGKSLDISELSADLSIRTQKQIYGGITESEAFKALRTKTDPDVNIFVMAIDAATEKINSPEYKQQTIENIKQNQQATMQGQGISNPIDLVKKQIPGFQLMEQYLWLFEAILVASIFLPLANIIASPLAMLFGIILDKLITADLPQETN